MSACGVALLYSVYVAPEHNAYIERFFRTLKAELYFNLYDIYSEAITFVEAYIYVYNNNSVHSTLGYVTLGKYYQQGILQKIA